MNSPIEIAQSLKNEIESDSLVIEYRQIKEAIKNNQELQKLKKEIAQSKLDQNHNLHKQLLNRYNSHPLVQNYLFLLEELKSYLFEISEIVNKK